MVKKGFGAVVALSLAALAGLPATLEAQQYFGRNKVQYDDFDFRVLQTPHWDIHFYPEATAAVEDAARMGERWYERFARTFQHEFEQSKPLILYADHPDFQQTNTLQGFINEGTGGVTESLKNRVIMPLTGSYWDTDHVLGHEIVHAFQYNIAQSTGGGTGLQGLFTLPLWLVEGMAEYMSVGRDDPLTAMWLRDAIRRDDFPTIRQMTREQRFFPYRFGQALWAYIGGTYGDDAVASTFRRSLRIGFPGALQQVLGVSHDTLSVQWARSVEAAYAPLMEGREAPEELGTVIVDASNGGSQNVSPSVSPDGRYVAFLSEKDLFSVELYLAEVATGRIVRKITNTLSDPHSDALRYIDSSGTWSPDGSQFLYVVFADGDNQMLIVDSENGGVEKRLRFDEYGIGAINNPAWSPDGRYLVFSGMVGGISDLFLYDFETEEVTQLTDDKFADYHPAWSPDSRTVAFASDRGPETDFQELVYSKFQIATIDVASRQVTPLRLLGNVRHSNPQYAPDGRSIYFLSDADGFSDVYRTDVATGEVFRVTGVATGISGIVPLSPALSVAAETGEMVVSVFSSFGFTLHRLPANAAGAPLPVMAAADPDEPIVAPAGRALPPGDPRRFNMVATYLDDPDTGLDMVGTYQGEDANDYKSSLALDFIGQPQVGVGADGFGEFVAGNASAFFSDMLGNKQVGVALIAQGTFKDIGGGLSYADLGDRWNWGVSGSRFPFQFITQGFEQETVTNPVTGEEFDELYFTTRRFRIFETSLSGQLAYPFSRNTRLEGSLGLTRYSYDVEDERLILDPFTGFALDFQRVDRPDLEPDALNLARTSMALVNDNAFFGFVSPIRGGRYRFEIGGDIGLAGTDVNFATALADWRRYWAPARNLTLGIRAMHFGRYGTIGTNAIQPLFLGFETFIRGYAFESFQASECSFDNLEASQTFFNNAGQFSQCPGIDRLFGQRLGVFNLEARVPLIGTEQFGLINFPFVPTELSFFFDGGVAWDSDNPVTLEWSTTGIDRVPVFSTGMSIRANLLGFLILESYFAYPFQRPERGWHWGFNFAPGW
jgi:Tol biopolymer transport system component